MTDAVRPSGDASSELRRTIWPWSTEIPLLSADPFNLDARLIIGGQEYIRCTGRDGYTLTGCARGISPEEGGSEPKLWRGGTPVDQIAWTTTEVVTEYPDTPTLAMVGRDFAWDAGDGNIYRYHVVLIEDEPVVIWDDEPPPAATDLTFLWASLLTGQTNVNGVAVDASGSIYRNANGSYRKYNASLVSQWIALASGLTGGHAATDGTSVFFTDIGGNATRKRLASTGANGSPVTIGSLGSGNGLFGSGGPIGLCFDGTDLWVVDPGNSRVQKFTASSGAYVSQFAVPAGSTGIALGPTSTHLYVLCAGAGEIRKHLKSDHSLVATFTLGNGTADGQISATAEGIAVDSTGRIWIADTGNHRIQVFDSAGVFLGKVGSFGSGDSQFKSPKQIAVGAGDVIYVADSGNNRLVTVQEEVVVPPGIAALVLVHNEDFSAVSSVSVNDVFTSAYDNYLIVLSNLSQSATQELRMRLRVGGTDNAGAGAYVFTLQQITVAGATSNFGSGGDTQFTIVGPTGNAATAGMVRLTITRPALADTSELEWTGCVQYSAGTIRSQWGGGVHEVATAYDGFTLFPGSGTISGTLRIYGMRNTV